MSNSSIKLRRSAIAGKIPDTEQLELGELAINTHDGKMFLKQDRDGNVSIRQVGADIADNTFYVAENGDDTNSGDSIAQAFLTLDKALAEATPGTTIFLKSGTYTLDNSAGGVDVPTRVSIVGDNLRTTNIQGSVSTNDLLYLRPACYVTGVTFRGHTDGAAAVAFNPDGSAGVITTSPYVQNCSSITTTGTGMRIDGSHTSGGQRSMVADAFTQINSGGIGVHLLNRGYAQLVSIFTVACDIGILAESGGQCSLTNSNCSFGNFGLKSQGTSPELYSGSVNGQVVVGTNTVVVDGLTEKPKYADAVKFSGDDRYYTVEDATDLVNGESTITLLDPVDNTIADNDSVGFLQRSLISASSITFEYVGTGTDLYNTPRLGGYPIQENEVVQDENDAGEVYFTSTDHKGDFRVGGELLINRTSGTIEGTTFDRSLFAVLTPYILALED
jgi:hypothetical protein